ncbi:zinc transporter 1 [Rhodotorula toruloides]|uniref:Zinc transporter 1 n=1 Tax=Rhodotorula toruloides TaxID=5286 RepID=A0A511KPQ6_RHOTO|nr:zinc transporter 1 [Rhodotorula toruloides]
MGQSTPPAMHKSAAQVAREKEIKLIRICMAITAVMMVGEIVVGYQLQVMSLVADSYHMMNDLAAFVVQLYADELANVDRTHGTETTAFSFGFARVELIANLIQGTLLVALCLTLSLESLQRFYSAEEVLLPPVVIGLGLLALAWNIANIYLFEDAHSHGQHSIRKGRRSAQSLVHPWTYRARLLQTAMDTPHSLARSLPSHRSSSISAFYSPGHTHSHPRSQSDHSHDDSSDGDSHSGHSHAVGPGFRQRFLMPQSALARHALGDAYGNVAIIVDGLASLLFGPKTARFSGLVKHWNGVVYVDPICSLIVVNVILKHALPLVTSSSFALMHAFDPIKADAVRSLLKRGNEAWLPTSLRERVSLTLVDLRIWRLSKTSTFATLKLRARFHDGGDATLHDVRALESAVRKAVSTKVDHCPEDQVAVDIDTGNAAVANDRVDSLPHHQNHHDKPASLRRTKSSNQLGRSSWRSSLPRAEASGALRYD